MDIESLRNFIAFVDTGSFTKAAERNHKTQSAISLQMKKLEEETQQSLFEKKGRLLTLTPAGKSLASYARRLVLLHDESLAQLIDHQNLPVLRLGCPDDYADSILPLLIHALTQRFPSLGIHITCAATVELKQKMHAKALDLAVVSAHGDGSEGFLITQDKGVWVHGGFPHLADNETIPLVLYQSDCRFHSAAIDAFSKRQQPFTLVCESTSATAIKSLLKKGLGISAMAGACSSLGLNIIEHPSLPELPYVDILLTTSDGGHPALTPQVMASLAREVAKAWQQHTLKD